MKKMIGIATIMALLLVQVAFAEVRIGDRISTYDDNDAYVGPRGYIEIDRNAFLADVYLCALKDGTIKEYGMDLQNSNQIAAAKLALDKLKNESFAEFDHYGCKRLRIY